MNFVMLRTQLGGAFARIWDWWMAPDEDYDDYSFYEPDVPAPYTLPPPLPMTERSREEPEHSPTSDLILVLKATRDEFDENLNEPISIDDFAMDEIRRLIIECCPHQISARFSFLARWDEVVDPVERWVNLNQVATMLMTIEMYFWSENPRVRILRRACEARARMAQQLLDVELAA